MISKVAYIIRKEVKNVKEDLPWSLQPNVLTSSQKLIIQNLEGSFGNASQHLASLP